jgi:hypothetical protein
MTCPGSFPCIWKPGASAAVISSRASAGSVVSGTGVEPVWTRPGAEAAGEVGNPVGGDVAVDAEVGANAGVDPTVLREPSPCGLAAREAHPAQSSAVSSSAAELLTIADPP